MFTASTSAAIWNRKIHGDLARKPSLLFLYLEISIVVFDLAMMIVVGHRLQHVYLRVDHHDVLNRDHRLVKDKEK